MKKRSITLVLVVFLFSQVVLVNAGLPVVDWSALIQRALQSTQKLAQWHSYIEKYKEFHNEFKRYKYAYMTIYRGFKDFDSLNDIFINTDNISNFLNMVYHDQNKIDTWSDIFIESRNLEDKYKGIEDNSYLKENPLYKNPSVQKFIDKKIESNTARLKDLKGGIELAKNYRKTEETILSRINMLQEKIKSFAKEGGDTGDGTGTAEVNRLLFMNSTIRLENLRLEAEMASLIRRNFERTMKLATEELDIEGEMGRAAQEELKNYEELKKGSGK